METMTHQVGSQNLNITYTDNPLAAGLEKIRDTASYVRSLPDENRIYLKEHVDYLLSYMDKIDASDIDFGGEGCAGRIWYRVHGNKKPVTKGEEYAYTDTNILVLNLLTPRQIDHLLEFFSLDFSYTVHKNGVQHRYRSTVYLDLNNLALNMRRINTEIRSFKEFNFHPEVARALSLNYLKFGLTLVTGITGSGKSTTLDTIIDANNRTCDSHIVIIASPVELVHQPKRSIVRHREVGRDVRSFKHGAIEALRQDPDIIMLGEMRDQDTIETALEITDSGHKTFSTLHTASAMESIARIIGEIEVNQQERVRNRLADVLTCVISQKLVPTIDGKRILAKEVLLASPSVKAAIKNNNIDEIYQMMNEGSHLGMNTLEQDLKRLFQEKKITLENAVGYANNKTRIRELLNMDI